jgi:two-component system, chemotaxis family, CheB/CheR fusion protein
MAEKATDFDGGPWQLIDALPAPVYVTDPAGRITYFNEAAAALWGYRPKLHSDQWCGSWRLYWLDGTPMPHDQCPMAIVLKQGRAIRGGQAMAERPDGTLVPFMAFPTPLRDASGTLIGAVNMLVETSEQQRAKRIERRLAAIVESSDDAIISKDLDSVVMTWNKAAERMFGYLAAEAIGRPITILIPSDRHNEELEILARIHHGEHVDHFETIRKRKDGSLVDVSLSISPLADDSGKIVGASKIVRDITDQKRTEERQKVLMAELDHRVKNVLARVDVVAMSMHQSSNSVDEFVRSLRGRIQAMAVAHDLLSQSGWRGVGLTSLVHTQLAPYATDGNITISGTDLTLTAAETQAVAMVFHELVTNAAKYGALSVPEGQVSVSWDRKLNGDATAILMLEWRELRGPPVATEVQPGYGTGLIRDLVPHELGGKVDLVFDSGGVICRVEIPN